ncbi:hypothetical protein BDZ45DRAFT_354042 [Acephala macrosclerotiorum]|nr:hypothetical protein BDZ45DRAFT_354042 [Acephala macrosclerotiorum]
MLSLDRRARSTLNLFKTRTPHPVEHALELAKYASDENDAEEFKKQRKIILEFLEPQYQRIMEANNKLATFIRGKGRYAGLYGNDHNMYVSPEDKEGTADRMKHALEGTKLLQSYANAFQRDLTPEVELLVNLHHDIFTAYYGKEERGKELANVYEQLRGPQNWYILREGFECSANDMKVQHLAIRRARKALFEFDRTGTDTGCEIDAEAWRKDGRFDWGNGDSDLASVDGSDFYSEY